MSDHSSADMESQSVLYKSLPVHENWDEHGAGSECSIPSLEYDVTDKDPATKASILEKAEFSIADSIEQSPSKLRNRRVSKLVVFLALEIIWLSFGLVVYFVSIAVPSGDISVGRLSTSSAALFISGLGTIGILWQIIAAISVADLVREIFSGEWYELLKRLQNRGGQTVYDIEIDRVSTLVSGRMAQAKHAFLGGHSTLRYKFAFIIALLQLALHSLAPDAISVSGVEHSNTTTLSIGALYANYTPSGGPDSDFTPLSDEMALLLRTKATALEQKVVRFEYVVQVEHSNPDFFIEDDNGNPINNVTFGMPPRDVHTMDFDRMSYQSDAISYDFSCQWLAPTLMNGTMGENTTWMFGEDKQGTIDVSSLVDNKSLPLTYVIYPLDNVTSAGIANGSFAWFLYGLTDDSYYRWARGGVDLGILIDLSSVPASEKTVNDTFWTYITSDINTPNRSFAYQNVSTTASVLFCDPQMTLGRVEVDIVDSGSVLRPSFTEGDTAAIGNIDPPEIARMLSESLNGIPWDDVLITAEEKSSRLSRLAAEFLFLPPKFDDTNQYSVYVPQSLANISSTLNAYTSIAAMSAYLDGSMGSMEIQTSVYNLKQTLVINWPQWFASLSIVVTITVLVVVLTVRDEKKNGDLVPLTLFTAQKYYQRRQEKEQSKDSEADY